MKKVDLYEYVAQHYSQMSRSELATIAKEALYKLYELQGEEDYMKTCEVIIEEQELELDAE